MMTEQKENEKADLEVHQSEPLYRCDKCNNNVIILEYNIDKLDYDTVRKVHNAISQTFPNNKVISLPNAYSFKSLTKEEALEMIEGLKKFLEDGQN